jgi:electron transfer flavoprotein beta subunit
MKICVCLKQVPDTESKIKISADQSGIDTAGIKWVINPYDEYAVEEAIKLKEANPGSTVTVFSLGPKKRTADSVRTALAMGADEGVLIDGPEYADSLSTAKGLSAAIKADGPFDIIFSGKLAIDDNGSSVSQMLAEFLNVPHATVVSKFTKTSEGILIERDIEGGAREVLQLMLPAVIAANKGLNLPRYASLPGIMKAKKKVLKELDFAALGLALEFKVKFSKFSLPPEKPAAKLISGDSIAQVSELVKLLRDEAKAL